MKTLFRSTVPLTLALSVLAAPPISPAAASLDGMKESTGMKTAGGMQAQGPRTFKIHVENVSTTATLKLSNGGTAPAPTSPVFWTVFTGRCPLFSVGKADQGWGLESLAEDGNPTALVAKFTGMAHHAAAGAVAVPNGDTDAGPLLPGKSFDITLTAERGQRLMLAMMFGQSNDLFYAPDPAGIALFDKQGAPITGDITKQFVLWDAGTEVNQEPGLGADQGPRQKGPNTGTDEHGMVRVVKDGFPYPTVTGVLKVTVTPTEPMMHS